VQEATFWKSETVQTHLLPTAILRFQLLLIELIENRYLEFDAPWRFNIRAHENIGDFARLAIEDFFLWWEQLCGLRKCFYAKPEIEINYITPKGTFHARTDAINIDFSLLKRYTDTHTQAPDVLFLRTGYDDEKEYFRVGTAELVKYEMGEGDKERLEFFLKNLYGFDEFRPGQFHIIENALRGRDTVGLLPTGSGKSLCFQLATFLQPGPSLVVCPIKSLMQDQYENLKDKQITRTAYINSDLSPKKKEEKQQAFAKGKYLFCWMSPERFQIETFRKYLSTVNANFSIAYAVIDEVHCMSEWGHSFRTSYLNLTKTVGKYCPNTPFLGLTATASPNVLKDIRVEFARNRQELPVGDVMSKLDYSREELQFEVQEIQTDKYKYIEKLLKELQDMEDFMELDEKAGLVFTPFVNGGKGCYALANALSYPFPDKVNWYSGKAPEKKTESGVKIPIMSEKELQAHKKAVQQNFKNNVFPLMVATKAFGMGIDKNNIAYTFHYGIPSSVESLYQEAGRAGRWDMKKPENKNKKAKCYVLFTPEFQNAGADYVEEFFSINTSIDRMKEIRERVGWDGKDLFGQLFLFLSGLQSLEEDFNLMKGIVDSYFKKKSVVTIEWQEAKSTFSVNEETLQKAIYRLAVLGIVGDWTTDFRTYYKVSFKSIKEEKLLGSLNHFVQKYEPGKNVLDAIHAIDRPSILEKCIIYLLQWTFEKITYSRKQSLKTLYDWCNEYTDSDSFKQRIDSYFTFTEASFILQHIAENPADFSRWFEVFYRENEETQTKHPAVEQADMEDLRDRLSRFLESYSTNMGLNMVSGIIRLFLRDFDDKDGRERFENSFEQIAQYFEREDLDRIIDECIQLSKVMSESSKEEMALSMLKYFPALLEYLAEALGLPQLIHKKIAENLFSLQKVNTQLYEQLSRI